MHFNSPPLSLGVYIFEMEKLVISAFLYNKIPILSLSFSPSLPPSFLLFSLSPSLSLSLSLGLALCVLSASVSLLFSHLSTPLREGGLNQLSTFQKGYTQLEFVTKVF